MTEQEKILRVALEEIKQIKWMDKSDVGCGFIAARALKKADATKDGPSEGDKERLQNIASMALDSIFWKDIEWLISNNKKNMGIE